MGGRKKKGGWGGRRGEGDSDGGEEGLRKEVEELGGARKCWLGGRGGGEGDLGGTEGHPHRPLLENRRHCKIIGFIT